MNKTCAMIGSPPMCFPWGFDEEDEDCAALKLILINWISKLRGEGRTRFAVSMDCGVGLYAAEIILGLAFCSGIPFSDFTKYESQNSAFVLYIQISYRTQQPVESSFPQSC